MKFLLRLIALPVLILFVLALPLSLVLRNMGALIFDADTTKAFVHDNLMDSELARSLARRGAEQLLTSEQEGGTSQKVITDLFGQLSEEDWRQITEIIAPRAMLDQTLGETIDAFTEWLDDAEAEFPSLSVDLSAWKASTIDNADELVAVFLDALPECGQEATQTMAQQSLIMQVESLPSCRPPEPQYSQMISQAGPLVARMLEPAPDNFDLGQITQGAEAPRELIELKTSLIQARTWLAWGWVAVLAIGLLAAALAATGLRGFLTWAGWPLLLAGLITLTLGLSMYIFNYRFLDQVFALLEDSPAISALAASAAGGMLQLVGGPLMLQGLIAAALAAGCLLYARALHQKEISPGIPIKRKRIGL
ncbi:MAG TPA: hypothetical protein VIH14_02540 [Anaerolineales bacterium]